MTEFNIIERLLKEDRSVRRFDQKRIISEQTLLSLVSLTRYCASGRNMQPLRYKMIFTADECSGVFPLLAWAGYLQEWNGPEEGERPVAYLVQCLDTTYGKDCLCDDGLQLQAITLGARALGIGSCIIKAFNAPKLAEMLSLPEDMQPRYVLALGYPVEKVTIETTDGRHDADIKYFRTPDGVHHVPKRPLSELVI